MRLKFIGHDPKLKTGKAYYVHLIGMYAPGGRRSFRSKGIIVDIQDYGVCPYESLEGFMRNWAVIDQNQPMTGKYYKKTGGTKHEHC